MFVDDLQNMLVVERKVERRRVWWLLGGYAYYRLERRTITEGESVRDHISVVRC